MVVVDTSVWIDYVNGSITPQTNLLDIEFGPWIGVITFMVSLHIGQQ